MREALTEVVEGWTQALPFRLDADGVPVDLTGMTVAIVLKNAQGTTINASTSGITVTSATGGVVEYLPSTSGDFYAAGTPYRVRFKVTDALSKTVYFPNVDPDLLKVNEV